MADTSTTSTITQELPAWYQPLVAESIARARGVANQAYQPYTGSRIQGFTPDQLASFGTVQGAQGSWNPYANMAQSQFNQASELPGAFDTASPYLGMAANIGNQDQTAGYLGAATGDINQAQMMSGLGAASPYLGAAGQTFPGSVDAYMSPYTDKVLDTIASRGARNLQENLMPAVGDTFMGSGQFGSERHRDFANRALRDTQEGILNQQASALESGYQTAGNLFNADANRMAGLANTAGGLTGADATRSLAAAQGRQGLANTALSQAGQQINSNLGVATGAGNLLGQDIQNRTGLGQSYFNLGQGIQGLQYTDAAAQGAIGQQQQQLGQTSLDTAYKDFLEQRNYPQDMATYFSNIVRGYNPGSNTSQQGTTTAPDPSTISQIAGLGTGLLGLGGAAGLFKRAGGRIKRGMVEGSPQEEARDRIGARRAGLPMSRYEGSPADMRQDRRDKVRRRGFPSAMIATTAMG